MRKIFIASHAHWASGIVSSAEFLAGKADHVTVFDAYLDETSVESHVEAFLDSLEPEDQAILLSDIYGGSVNQILYRYLDREGTILITGANLALVLELISSRENISEEELNRLIEMARDMLKRVEYDEGDTEEMTDEDFF